jgi:trans-aconitate methyltransferase
MKSILRALTPPIMWRTASRARKAMSDATKKDREFAYGVEQPPEYYDRAFEKAEHWKDHYTDSPYFPLWTVIADRIRRMEVERIFDIGCGPGQIACLLRDIGVPEYRGLDFSTARIEGARTVCPEYEFVAASIFEDDTLETWSYDCVMIMEFLEHVERDLEVVDRIRAGTLVLATVPNFPARGHVRHFEGVSDVEGRYGAHFSELSVVPIVTDTRGKTYYVMEGVR